VLEFSGLKPVSVFTGMGSLCLLVVVLFSKLTSRLYACVFRNTVTIELLLNTVRVLPRPPESSVSVQSALVFLQCFQSWTRKLMTNAVYLGASKKSLNIPIVQHGVSLS